jgi:exodeoxyribonuclease-3
MELRFDTPRRKLSLISCYFSGSSGEEAAGQVPFPEEFDPTGAPEDARSSSCAAT